jgi:nitrate/nitrite-specific signal transduction histidine kinase
MEMKGSLRAKIIAWSFVPTVIILITVALVTFYSYQKVTEDLVLSQSDELVRYKGDEVYKVLTEIINPPLTNFIFNIDKDKALPLIERAKNTVISPNLPYIFVGGIVFLDQNGMVVYSNFDDPDVIQADWSDRDFYIDSRLNPGVYAVFGDLSEIGEGNQTVLPIALGLLDENNAYVGAAVFMLRMMPEVETPLYLAIKARCAGEKIYILDRTNRVVFHPDVSLIGRSFSDVPELQPLFDSDQPNTNENHFPSFRAMDKDVVISQTLLQVSKTKDWRIIKEQSWDDLMRPSLKYRQLLLILLTAGVFVPVCVVTYGVGHLMRPIKEMIIAAKEVAGGNFGRKISAHTDDELEELAIQFNRMSDELAQSYSLLEHRVADRTYELEVINSISDVVSQSLNIHEVLENALEKLLEVTKMDAGAAYRLNRGTEMFELFASHGFSESYVSKSKFLPLDLIGYNPEGNKAEVFASLIEDYPIERLKNLLIDEGIKVAIRLPLVSKGKVLGYIGLSRRSPEIINENEKKIFVAIGQQISVAMENANLYEQAEENAVTAERNRLARDLHDAVTQTLFSASLIAEVLPELYRINPQEAGRRTQELRELSRGALAEMRTLLLELRPSALVQVSLSDLIKQLCESATGRSRLPIRYSVEGKRTLPQDVKIAFYRITQEALNNIVKYANATEVKIDLLKTNSFIEVSIRDNGIGFEEAKVTTNHFGLRIMRERAESIGAELRIVTDINQGTTVTITWNDPEMVEEE